MSINQISVGNTFGQLVTAVSAMIAVANNLTDGPQVQTNSSWTFTNPGVGINVASAALITIANVGILNLSTANISNATFETLNTSVANATVSNVVTLNCSTANISNATIARTNTSYANISDGIATLSNLITNVANVNSGTFAILNTTLANATIGNVVTLNSTSGNISNLTVAFTMTTSILNVSSQLNTQRANATVANVTSSTTTFANASFANATVANVSSGTFGVLNASTANTTNSNIVRIGTVGTTFVIGAANGDIVHSQGGLMRSVNVAGTGLISVIGTVSGSDNVTISPGGQDIRWGVPLVALGGGAAPTLGTIGGTGPATSAQNSWLRLVDSTGAVFWVPVWK